MDSDADTARFSWLVAAAADARGATPPKAAAQKQGQDKDDATVRRTVKCSLTREACPTFCEA